MTDLSPSLRAAREETIDDLCRRFARDELSLPELERRLTRAREARSRNELRQLLADLGRPAAPPPAPTGGAEPAPSRAPSAPSRPRAGSRRASHVAIAVMGGTRRAGQWSPASNMLAIAVMGGVELDFTDADLEPGVTDITCFAMWGAVEITVPPDVHVDTHGLAIMGGFEQYKDVGGKPDPDAPTIRVNGLALMGGVEVRVKERGGSGRGAKLRSGRAGDHT